MAAASGARQRRLRAGPRPRRGHLRAGLAAGQPRLDLGCAHRGDERDLGGGADQLARAGPARAPGADALGADRAARRGRGGLRQPRLAQPRDADPGLAADPGDGGGPAPRRHGPRGRLAHDPRRAQRLRRAGHPLHLPLRRDRPGPGRAVLRRPPEPAAPTSSSSATRP